MKILFISNLYPPHFLGGYEILCANTAHQLTRRGHDVFVLTSTHGIDRPQTEDHIFRELELYIPFSEPPRLDRKLRRKYHRINYELAKKRIQEIQPDVVFVWSQLRLTTGAAHAAQDLNYPVAFTMNDDHLRSHVPARFGRSPVQFMRYITDKFFYPEVMLKKLKLDHVTCISKNLQQNLLNQDIPVENAKIIYQGIPIEQFPMKENYSEIKNPVRLCFSGQLHEYKGVHLAIAALEKLSQRFSGECTLDIAGTSFGDYSSRLRGQAQYLGIEAAVSFKGRIPYESIPQFYREHDILLFTSLWDEPFGLCHLEAMASGTPVISTFRGGMKEFLKDEENCLIFDPEIHGHLAYQIERLIQEDELRLKIIKNAHEMVTRDFTVDRYVREIDEFLEWTVADHNAKK